MYRIDLNNIEFCEERNLYIIGGVHGAGKSTFCRAMLEVMKVPYVTPEELKKELPSDIPRTQLLKQLRLRVDQYLEAGQSFYFEHVMSGSYVEKLINSARRHDFRIHMIYIDIESAAIAKTRVNKRVMLQGHNVDQSLISPRLKESRENFKTKYALRADYWAIYKNSDSPYQKNADGKGGNII